MLKVDVYFQLWTRRTRKVQEKVHPRCTFSDPMPGQIAFDFLSSAKRVNNRESNIARGWSYSQQSNLYLKKAALYSLENPRILWSCQPLISKGSLADRDLDLSYGARELWFWHQICRYYTVCRHVEAYTLGRLSIACSRLSPVPLYFSSLSLPCTALHYLNAWNRLGFP